MRWSKWVLVAVGILIFSLGAGVGLLAMQLANPHAALEADQPVVMTEDCLSCHSDTYRAAERSVQPMVIQRPAARTIAVAAMDVRVDTLSVVPLADDTRPYAASDSAMALRPAAGRMLVQTDDGVALLPEMWSAFAGMGAVAGDLCEACHEATPTVVAPGEF
jgi:hypothetical protein